MVSTVGHVVSGVGYRGWVRRIVYTVYNTGNLYKCIAKGTSSSYFRQSLQPVTADRETVQCRQNRDYVIPVDIVTSVAETERRASTRIDFADS